MKLAQTQQIKKIYYIRIKMNILLREHFRHKNLPHRSDRLLEYFKINFKKYFLKQFQIIVRTILVALDEVITMVKPHF